MRITIIGAGIVGSAAAHRLLDAGHEVTLLDTEGKTGRPSDGNAGWIAHTDIMPLASPKVWRNLPRWMVDPLGPLTIRPGYLPQLAPWLLPPELLPRPWPGRAARELLLASRRLALAIRKGQGRPALFRASFDEAVESLV